MARADDGRPLPEIDEESRGFWEACVRHELVFQRCASCRTFRHPPRAVCPACLSSEVAWVRSTGQGAVYSFTVTHQNHASGFRQRLPYVLAVVEVEEGVRLMTTIVGCEPDAVRIGLPVEVEWDDVTGGISLPVFRPRA